MPTKPRSGSGAFAPPLRPPDLEISDKATLAFGAYSYSEAFSLTSEDWLKDNLGTLSSQSVALYTGSERMTVSEATIFKASVKRPGCDIT